MKSAVTRGSAAEIPDPHWCAPRPLALREVRIFDNLLHTRAPATAPAEVERLLTVAEDVVASMLNQLDVDFPGDVRLTCRGCEAIELRASNRAELARLVTDLVSALTSFAARTQIELERSQ